MILNISNFLLFQSAWLLTIVSAAKGRPWLGVMFTLLWATLHLLLNRKHRRVDGCLLVFAALTACVLEYALLLQNMIAYPAQTALVAPVPLWMIALWLNLALTLNYSLSWLKRRYLASAVLASVSAPIAYGAGERLGAVMLPAEMSLLAIGLAWSLAMPFLFWMANVLDKPAHTLTPFPAKNMPVKNMPIKDME